MANIWNTEDFAPSPVFNWDVALGRVRGYEVYNKFGENPDIDTGTDPEDVWDFGGIYTFSTTADIDTVSSSDAGDNQDISIQGLDENWNMITQTATLNGQTKVTLTTPLIRVFRMANSDDTNLAGTMYCYVDGAITAGVPDTDADVRAVIINGNNQTLMCIFTIPAGYTGMFLGGYVATTKSSGNSATFAWKARGFGGVFQVKSKIGVVGTGSSAWTYHYGVPVVLPEKTDIKITCEEVEANNTAVSGGFDMVLIDNDFI